MATNFTWGTPNTFTTDRWTGFAIEWLDSNKFVCVFEDVDGSANTACVIGTVSGTTVSWGTKADITTEDWADVRIVVLDSTHWVVCGRFSTSLDIVACYDNSGTIEHGTQIEIDADAIPYHDVSKLTSTSFIISYVDNTDDNAVCEVGVISSNTTITMGTELEWKVGTFGGGGCCALDSTHAIVVCREGTTDGWSEIVSIANGDEITGGDEDNWSPSLGTYYPSVKRLSATKFVYSFSDNIGDDYVKHCIGTNTAGTLSHGSIYSTGKETYYFRNSSLAVLDETHFFTTIRDINDAYKGILVEGVVNGSAISYESPMTVQAVVSAIQCACNGDFDANKIAVLYTNANAWQPKVKIGLISEITTNTIVFGCNL